MIWEIAQNSGTIIAFVQTVVCPTPTPTPTTSPTATPTSTPTPTPGPTSTPSSYTNSFAYTNNRRMENIRRRIMFFTMAIQEDTIGSG